MNKNSDDDLLAVFAHARRRDHEEAPAWRPELLDRPVQRARAMRRWIPATLVAACVIVMAIFLIEMPRHETQLSEVLPLLLDSPPGELFASLEPSLLTFEAPSDFLLPPQLNPSIP
ncbi:MAG: hypothetical protein JWR15_3519 [Prosthecobacter sp.]|nr:hypothetical protein [Prosthecobacter sp.]